MNFYTYLENSVKHSNSLLCIGLDPDETKLPSHLTGSGAYVEFSKAIVDATADIACAFKPNSAFYEAKGADGIKQLKQICDYIKRAYPDIPVLLDAKRADIGNTNSGYAAFAFEYLGADAITINPYLGEEAIRPFLDYKDKGIIVLCRTSNPGSGEFQDLRVGEQTLYQTVAQHVCERWNTNNNCLLVVGATYPTELAELRKVCGDDMVFLVPGVGAQGADVEATVKAGLNNRGDGIVINASRSIIFASSGKDFAAAARAEALNIRDEINKARSTT